MLFLAYFDMPNVKKSPLNGIFAGCASLPWVYISAVPEYHAIS